MAWRVISAIAVAPAWRVDSICGRPLALKVLCPSTPPTFTLSSSQLHSSKMRQNCPFFPVSVPLMLLFLFAHPCSSFSLHHHKRSFSPMDSAEFFAPTLAADQHQRSFVGIRTFPSSKAIFGTRQLRERLAERAEQRREQREALLTENRENGAPSMDEGEERRQRVYDRLLCIFATQSPAACKVL